MSAFSGISKPEGRTAWTMSLVAATLLHAAIGLSALAARGTQHGSTSTSAETAVEVMWLPAPRDTQTNEQTTEQGAVQSTEQTSASPPPAVARQSAPQRRSPPAARSAQPRHAAAREVLAVARETSEETAAATAAASASGAGRGAATGDGAQRSAAAGRGHGDARRAGSRRTARKARLRKDSLRCADLFPYAATSARGHATVSVAVDPTGEAGGARVIEALPAGEGFALAATACAARLRFVPARDDHGLQVAARAVVRLHFQRGG